MQSSEKEYKEILKKLNIWDHKKNRKYCYLVYIDTINQFTLISDQYFFLFHSLAIIWFLGQWHGSICMQSIHIFTFRSSTLLMSPQSFLMHLFMNTWKNKGYITYPCLTPYSLLNHSLSIVPIFTQVLFASHTILIAFSNFRFYINANFP